MTNESKIRDAIRLIWYNLPDHPATFAQCSRCKAQSARGGGACLQCAQIDLAELVGAETAELYVQAVTAIRKLERDMIQ